ncbi:MAG: hypothetical protein KatS3mg129_1751 [Leptospiraceae bacterium]|nr:MAG: hypothetical protein KatS3mg129_1751 [Leptospiraceae bacterium]
MDKKITRKEFLVTAGVVGSTFIFGSSIITSCKKKEETQEVQETKEQAQTETPKCDDLSGLTPEDINQRKQLQYTDNSPKPDQTCSNCALFVPPENNTPCGKCNLVKGPISPNGWCTSWVQKG